MKTGIFSHPDCLRHQMGWEHPEQPDRLRVIHQALTQSDIQSQLTFFEAPLASKEQLLRVHDSIYLEKIFNTHPQHELIYLDPDTALNQYTLQAALRAAGAVVAAVDLVMQQEIQTAFCNVRPPGHHAEHAKAMGFCFFNNIAVGVAHALAAHQLKRIAIIDFDVHHGNGTENIFKNDNRVLLCSSFQHPFYPYDGADTKSDHIINLPLLAGTTGSTFFSKIEKYWLPAILAFKPDLLFFSAGFDAHKQDGLANLQFEVEDYAQITRYFKKLADQLCEGRIISVLEGGYALNVLGLCAEAHVSELVKGP